MKRFLMGTSIMLLAISTSTMAGASPAHKGKEEVVHSKHSQVINLNKIKDIENILTNTNIDSILNIDYIKEISEYVNKIISGCLVTEGSTEATTKEQTTKKPVTTTKEQTTKKPVITTQGPIATTKEQTTKRPIFTTKEQTTEATTKTQTTRAPIFTTKEQTTRAPIVTTKEQTTEATTVSNISNNGSFASQVLSLVNNARAKEGLKPLTLNSNLSSVAQKKAQDMQSNNYFSHTSPTYGSPFDMMRSAGIRYGTAGENIAKGQVSAQQVFTDWMNSPGHRANILNPNYTQMGLGVTTNGQKLWSQMFIG